MLECLGRWRQARSWSAVEETPFELTDRARDIQARSRRFVEDVLFPLEEEAERLPRPPAPGRDRPREVRGGRRRPRRRAPQARARRPGLVDTSSGRSSKSSSAARRTRSTGTSPTPTTSGITPRDAQIERYLLPALRGEIRDAYAVTERDAGSDPSRIAATAERDGGRLSPERREVVRHDRRRRRGPGRDGERDRRRPQAADALRRRRRRRRRRDDRRPGVHPLLPRRPPHLPLHRRRARPRTR